jgi:hypothetical protein
VTLLHAVATATRPQHNSFARGAPINTLWEKRLVPAQTRAVIGEWIMHEGTPQLTVCKGPGKRFKNVSFMKLN